MIVRSLVLQCWLTLCTSTHASIVLELSTLQDAAETITRKLIFIYIRVQLKRSFDKSVKLILTGLGRTQRLHRACDLSSAGSFVGYHYPTVSRESDEERQRLRQHQLLHSEALLGKQHGARRP